jgi:hypothetical protein
MISIEHEYITSHNSLFVIFKLHYKRLDIFALRGPF